MPASLTRRKFLSSSGLLAATAALAACAPAAPAPAAPASEATAPPAEGAAAEALPPTSAPSGEEVALRMAFWDAWSLDAYEHEAELFHEQNPNVTVTIEMTSVGFVQPEAES
jgi:ABC-type glycerol-3-phosphate transport system substrate-binding protein